MSNWRKFLRKYLSKYRKEDYSIEVLGGTEHDKRCLEKVQQIIERKPIYVPENC